MADPKSRLEEDRMLRNAAKHLVSSDYQNLRGDVQDKGLASRFAHRMREGAEGLVDDGTQFARENQQQLGFGAALGAGLLGVWLFRDQIADLAERYWHHAEDFAERVVSNDS